MKKISYIILGFFVLFLVGCAQKLQLPNAPDEPSGVVGQALPGNNIVAGDTYNFISVSPASVTISSTQPGSITVTVTDNIILKKGSILISTRTSQPFYDQFTFTYPTGTGGCTEVTNSLGHVYIVKDPNNFATKCTATATISLPISNFASGTQNGVLVFSASTTPTGFDVHNPGRQSMWISKGFTVAYQAIQQPDFVVDAPVIFGGGSPLADGFTRVDITVRDTANPTSNQQVGLFVNFAAGSYDIVNEVRTSQNGANIDTNGDGKVGTGFEDIGPVVVGVPKSFWIKVPYKDSTGAVNQFRINAVADSTNAITESNENNNEYLTSPLVPSYHSSLSIPSVTLDPAIPIVGQPTKLTFTVVDSDSLHLNNGNQFSPIFDFEQGTTPNIVAICAANDPQCAQDLDTDDDGKVMYNGNMINDPTKLVAMTGFDAPDKILTNRITVGTPYTLYVVFGSGAQRLKIFVDGANELLKDSATDILYDITPVLQLPAEPPSNP